MDANISTWWAAALPLITAVGLKIIGAILLYMVGRALISFGIGLVDRALTARSFDPTLQSYISNVLAIALHIVLVVAILGYFGVETTSFAALLAALGVAIGAAWAGLLGNFAAGAFLIIFRPFKVGDFVTAGTVTGTVQRIGLFNTTIVTLDNVETIVGDGKISGEVIQNFSTLPYRRVDLTAQLAFGVDAVAAMARLRAELALIPNVTADPPPDVEILEFNALGTLLAVRPYCNNAHYWQVYFDTNRLIATSFGSAGYPGPFTRHDVKAGA